MTNIQASLVFTLHALSNYHLEEPLSTFGLLLPVWGMPCGWALAILPVCPLLFGAIVHLIWGDKGVPRLAVRTKVDLYGLFIFDIPTLSTVHEANRKVV